MENCRAGRIGNKGLFGGFVVVVVSREHHRCLCCVGVRVLDAGPWGPRDATLPWSHPLLTGQHTLLYCLAGSLALLIRGSSNYVNWCTQLGHRCQQIGAIKALQCKRGLVNMKLRWTT
jgi:hypothetical protein